MKHWKELIEPGMIAEISWPGVNEGEPLSYVVFDNGSGSYVFAREDLWNYADIGSGIMHRLYKYSGSTPLNDPDSVGEIVWDIKNRYKFLHFRDGEVEVGEWLFDRVDLKTLRDEINAYLGTYGE